MPAVFGSGKTNNPSTKDIGRVPNLPRTHYLGQFGKKAENLERTHTDAGRILTFNLKSSPMSHSCSKVIGTGHQRNLWTWKKKIN